MRVEDTHSFYRVFSNPEFGEVEVIVLNGEPLFNANHVAKVLEIKDVVSTMRNWNEKYRRVLTNSIVAGIDGIRKFNNRGKTFLTKAGLFRLLSSTKSEKVYDFINSFLLDILGKDKEIFFVPLVEEREFFILLKDLLHEIGVKNIKREYKLFKNYRVDCYLPDFNLVIEYQTSYHYLEKNISKDEERNRDILNQGYNLLLLNCNDSIGTNLGKVVSVVNSIRKERLPKGKQF